MRQFLGKYVGLGGPEYAEMFNLCAYFSGSQPVVCGPPVVRNHLSGGPWAKPNILKIKTADKFGQYMS